MLPEAALHEYRQRVGLVWRESRDFLESRAPVEIERAFALVPRFEPGGGEPFRACPIEETVEHHRRQSGAARGRLEEHAFDLRPLAAVLGGAASHDLPVAFHDEKDR